MATDAHAIQVLYAELVGDPLVSVLPEQIAMMAASTNSLLLVACQEGGVHGTALLTICPDVMYRQQPFGVIENMVVGKEMRGRGLGLLLMNHLERFAASRDCSKLMLLSSGHRQQAHAFFQRSGFSGDSKRGFVKYRSQFSPES